jgi:hypothetical protein
MWGSLLSGIALVSMWDRARKTNHPPKKQRSINIGFLKFCFGILAFLWLVSTIGHAFGQTTFKNANGQIVGRSVTNNAGTTYYDASGRNTGRSTTNSTGTTFYNERGQVTGRSSRK